MTPVTCYNWLVDVRSVCNRWHSCRCQPPTCSAEAFGGYAGQLPQEWLTELLIIGGKLTRSQAVARIADRTASLHLWGSCDVIVTWPFDSAYAISYCGPLERSL